MTTDWILGCHSASGNEFDATVFVSSVKGSTARSETMGGRDIAAWSNTIFFQVTEALLHFGGIPVKYMGDGLLGFFAGDNHPSRAIRAALSARERVTDQLIVGLSSSAIHLTAIGHPSYARPDILGPTVSRAFRVREWVQSNVPGRIGASCENLRDLDMVGFQLFKSTAVHLKGLAEPVTIHEIVGEPPK